MPEPSRPRSDMEEQNRLAAEAAGKRVRQRLEQQRAAMTQADIEAEQRRMLDGWEEMRAFEAAGPLSRQSSLAKKALTPTFQRYVNTIWRPEQQGKIEEATKHGTFSQLSDVIKAGIKVPAHDLSNTSVALTRAQDFFNWHQTNGSHDDEDESTAHWPKTWLGVSKLLIEERQEKIVKAKSRSEGVRRKAINGLLEEGLSKADIERMGLRIKWDSQASTSATSSDGSGTAGSSKAAAEANFSGSNSSSSNNSKRKRKREREREE